ncbi:MAG TPA: hypothetical protein VLG71_02115 [Candidatus Limnocylindria bacterium]|nr:hypothetical protein [Candidatus Limnocylindria bacterium]
MKKNLMLSLAAGALLVSSQAQAIDINVNVDFDSYIAKAKALEPFVAKIVTQIKNGDFNGLRATLKADAGTADFGFLVDDLRQNLPAIRSALNTALNNINKVPDQIRGSLQAAAPRIRELMNNQYFVNAESYLAQVKPYARLNPAKIDAFVDGLQFIRQNAVNAYNKMADDLNSYYRNTLLPIAQQAGQVPAVDLTTLRTALQMVVDTINGKAVDLTDPNVFAVIDAIDQLKAALPKVVPLLPMLVQGTTELGLQANKAFDLVGKYNAAKGVILQKLPANVVDALSSLQDVAVAVENDAKRLGTQAGKMVEDLTNM